ncbi:hypothetical protein [Paraburkholderia sp. GAS32]|uniref:hypothetical protein n=1 Tax=Paraburkholderia sp. GAS32 TaxID=3035129 RepID=UPI003D1C819D
MKPTKTPYRVVPMDNKYGYQIHAGEGRGNLRIIATCTSPHGGAGIKTMTPQAKENAEFIVRACNSHELLMGLIQRVASLNPDCAEIGAGMLASLVADAKEALKKGELPL